jgi:hypothetical protein
MNACDSGLLWFCVGGGDNNQTSSTLVVSTVTSTRSNNAYYIKAVHFMLGHIAKLYIACIRGTSPDRSSWSALNTQL